MMAFVAIGQDWDVWCMGSAQAEIGVAADITAAAINNTGFMVTSHKGLVR